MNRVLHLVGSGHVGIVALHDGIVLRIAKGVFDPYPHLAARNGISTLIGFAEHGWNKRERHQSYNHKSRLHHGVFPRKNALPGIQDRTGIPVSRQMKHSPSKHFVNASSHLSG
jgi:hypothetical protein